MENDEKLSRYHQIEKISALGSGKLDLVRLKQIAEAFKKQD
ncbi:MAG: hypothetical protein WC374_05000 [Phycisphaerae bacterium]|jgi:hypothetical protein